MNELGVGLNWKVQETGRDVMKQSEYMIGCFWSPILYRNEK